MTYRFRDLLALEPLSADELNFILDQSQPFQEIQRHPLKKLATLRGKTVVLAFFENSTRTRLSFGTAASRLGADTMNLQAEASSLKKGETLLDTANNLNAMKPDCFVMRHSSSGAADFVARHLEIPVVNAGDGTHEHPSQGLLDALTIRDRKGTLKDLNVTILGDISHSRVARSNIHLLGKFGCRFTLCGPAMWVPRELEKIGPPGTPIRCVYRVEEALEDADVIIVLRVQTERLHEPVFRKTTTFCFTSSTPNACAWPQRTRSSCIPAPLIAASKLLRKWPTGRAPPYSNKLPMVWRCAWPFSTC